MLLIVIWKVVWIWIYILVKKVDYWYGNLHKKIQQNSPVEMVAVQTVLVTSYVISFPLEVFSSPSIFLALNNDVTRHLSQHILDVDHAITLLLLINKLITWPKNQHKNFVLAKFYLFLVEYTRTVLKCISDCKVNICMFAFCHL